MNRLARRGILAGAIAAAALGALAGHAGGAIVPTAPADEAVVPTLRPEFRWSDTTPAGAVRYEVRTSASGDPIATVSATPGPAPTSYAVVAQQDLPQDRRLSWFVRVHLSSGLFTDSPAAAGRPQVMASPPPALSGPTGLVNQASQVFSWTRPEARTSSTWTVLAGGVTVQEGVVSATEGQLAVPAPLADGAYQFRVVQRVGPSGSGGWDAAPAAIAFTVDTTPPGLLAITGAPPFPTTDATPSFSWTGAEPGAHQTWRVIGVGGGVAQGPGDGAAGAVTVGPLAPGSYAFEVRQQDAAGNAGDWRSHPFALVTPPPPALAAPPAVTRLRLPARNAKKLRPKAGARVRSLRPVLRWPTSRRATVYNVQLFVVGQRNKLRKIHSAFPRSPRLRVPRRELRRGRCYVWRVWPFIGKRFTKRPLGVSNFCVTATRR